MIEIPKARIYFLAEAEGGIQEGFAGMRPSFNINGELILCFVYPLDGHERMPRGTSHLVRLELPYGELTNVSSSIMVGAAFHLQLASKVIAKGEILKI